MSLVVRIGRQLHTSIVSVQSLDYAFPNDFFNNRLLFLNSRLRSNLFFRFSKVLSVTVVGLHLFGLNNQTTVHCWLPFLLRTTERGFVNSALGRWLRMTALASFFVSI